MEAPERRRLPVASERTTPAATFADTPAAGVAVVGAVRPLVGLALGDRVPSRVAAAIGAACVIASGALHLLARAILGRLMP